MKLAVVGAGYWGINLVRIFHRLGVLAKICDFSAARLTQLSADYPDVPVESSWQAVMADRSLDAVVIATPAATHYELAKQALLADKDVMVEKPMTLRCEETEDLIEIAESRRRILMVGHLLEYHPAVTRLKSLVEQGELGRIEYIYSNRLNLGKVRREENAFWSFAPHDISVILLVAETTTDPGHSDRWDLSAAQYCRCNGLDNAFRPWRPCPRVCQLAASLQRAKARGGG